MSGSDQVGTPMPPPEDDPLLKLLGDALIQGDGSEDVRLTKNDLFDLCLKSSSSNESHLLQSLFHSDVAVLQSHSLNDDDEDDGGDDNGSDSDGGKRQSGAAMQGGDEVDDAGHEQADTSDDSAATKQRLKANRLKYRRIRQLADFLFPKLDFDGDGVISSQDIRNSLANYHGQGMGGAGTKGPLQEHEAAAEHPGQEAQQSLTPVSAIDYFEVIGGTPANSPAKTSAGASALQAGDASPSSPAASPRIRSRQLFAPDTPRTQQQQQQSSAGEVILETISDIPASAQSPDELDETDPGAEAAQDMHNESPHHVHRHHPLYFDRRVPHGQHQARVPSSAKNIEDFQARLRSSQARIVSLTAETLRLESECSRLSSLNEDLIATLDRQEKQLASLRRDLQASDTTRLEVNSLSEQLAEEKERVASLVAEVVRLKTDNELLERSALHAANAVGLDASGAGDSGSKDPATQRAVPRHSPESGEEPPETSRADSREGDYSAQQHPPQHHDRSEALAAALRESQQEAERLSVDATQARHFLQKAQQESAELKDLIASLSQALGVERERNRYLQAAIDDHIAHEEVLQSRRKDSSSTPSTAIKGSLLGELESLMMHRSEQPRGRSSSNGMISANLTAERDAANASADSNATAASAAPPSPQPPQQAAPSGPAVSLSVDTTASPFVNRTVFELVHKCLQSTMPAMFTTEEAQEADGSATARSFALSREELDRLPVEALSQLASLLRTLLQVRSVQLMDRMDQRAVLQVELDAKRRLLDYLVPVIAKNPVSAQRTRSYSKGSKDGGKS